MPPKPDYLKEGKYAKFIASAQAQNVYLATQMYLTDMDPNQKPIIDGNLVELNQNSTKVSPEEELSVSDDRKLNSVADEKYVETIRTKLKTLHGVLDQKSKDPELKMFQGQLNLMKTMADTETGPFIEVICDHPYIDSLLHQFHTGPSFGRTVNGKVYGVKEMAEPDALGDTVDPVTGQVQEGYLTVMNAYWNDVNDMIYNEYERREINKNPNPEKEAEYLKKKSQLIDKVVAGFNKMSDFVDENGNSKYDPFLQNTINHGVGKDTKGDAHNDRNIQPAIAFMKGEKKAIENGWGMNDLGILGSLSEVSHELDKEIAKKQREIQKTNYEKRSSIIKKRIDEDKKRIEELKNNPPPANDAKAKKDYDRDMDSARRSLGMNERMYQGSLTQKARDLASLKELTDLNEKFSPIKDELMNTKVKNVADKIKLTDKYMDFLATATQIDNANLGKNIQHGIRVSNQTKQFGFRKNTENIVNPEEAKAAKRGSKEYEKINLLAQLDYAYADPMLDSTDDPEIVKLGADTRGDVMNIITNDDAKQGLPEPLTGTIKRNDVPKLKYEIEDKDIPLLRKTHQDISDKAKEIYRNSGNAVHQFPNAFKPFYMIPDVSKGNFSEAVGEDLFLLSAASNFGGAGPDMFRSKEGPRAGNRLEPDEIRDYLQDNGVARPIEEFFKGSREAFEAEYYRQNAEKSGWNDKKEKAYLAKLSAAYDKCLSGFEELNKLPEELHVKPEKNYYGNSLGHLTGRGTGDEQRDVAASMGGVEWRRKAIDLGWGSKDLQMFAALGEFEGNINKLIYQSEFKGEAEKVQKLREWKEKNLDPFKEQLLNKTVASAADKLCAITLMDEFREMAKNDDNELIRNAYNSSLKRYRDIPFSRSTNEYLDQVRKEEMEDPLFEKQPLPKKKEVKEKANLAYEEASKETLEAIRGNDEFNPRVMEVMAASYIKSKYLAGKDADANPEFINEKNPDRKVINKALDIQSKKYAKELIEKVKPANAAELADMLEFGNHEPAFEKTNERIDAILAKKRVDNFLSGGANTDYEKLHKTMDKATIGLVTFNGTFNSVMSEFKLLGNKRKEFAATVQKQMKKGQGVKLDRDEFSRYEKRVLEQADKIKEYLDSKDKKIRKKGGDPKNEADIDLLGKNGAKRYRAMLEAKKAVRDLYKATQDYKKNGFDKDNAEDYKTINESYGVDGKNFRHDAENEKFRSIDRQAREVSLNEEEKRRQAMFEFKKKSAPTAQEKKAFEDLIVESAQKTLFVETARSIYDDKNKNAVFNAETARNTVDAFMAAKSNDREMEEMRQQQLTFAKENVQKTAAESKKVLNNYAGAVNSFADNGKFKENSKQYDEFKKGVLADGMPFQKEFRKAVLETAQKGPVTLANVKKIRDDVVGKLIDNAKTREEFDKYQKFARAIGAANVADKGMQKRMDAHNNAKRNNNKVM